eukprot:TRINITY_DN111976_c0_g1_i1.p1 TRINITY_DN111976_c0_g1~~TRINITY_DN111976_c0_g1_i1.p1  ORF type:complete len:200 (+),score=29.57 TRINITY_DN111976_c0_g1_i1:104-703(+)
MDAQSLQYGASPDGCVISRSDALAIPHARHACHVAFIANAPYSLWGQEVRNTILMMMRFDGSLGFPGGFRDSPEEELAAVAQREVQEELGVEIEVADSDLFYTECLDLRSSKLCLHLFVKQISAERLEEMQIGARRYASDKHEVLGTVRVPLYVLGRDGKGLPLFLQNQFAGNGKHQLMNVIAAHGLLDKRDLEACKLR